MTNAMKHWPVYISKPHHQKSINNYIYYNRNLNNNDIGENKLIPFKSCDDKINN